MATLVEPPGTSPDFLCVSESKQFIHYLRLKTEGEAPWRTQGKC